VTTCGDEVHWDASTIDDADAHRVLDVMYDLPHAGGRRDTRT
jgi:hypothetical protein